MQARVTCPACQTTLGVNANHGDGTLLRCPKCRHEFAVRLRQPSAPAPFPHDPFAQPAPAYNPPPRPQVRPPAKLNTASSGGGSSSLLLIGLGGGAALAVACVVLVLIVVRMTAPQNQVADAAGQPWAAPAVQPPAVAAPAPSNPPVASQPASTGSQPASSVTPQPFARPDPPPPAAQGVPGGVAGLAPGGASGSQLAYRFVAGEEYAYNFSVKAEIAGTPQTANGGCTLTLSREAAPPDFGQQKSGQGNGSGFVVTSDGYIVTCAHVVEDSTKLEAVLGSQTYPAQVVAFDKEHDLAIIRIVASNLPTISLTNSDSVQLAEEVRAVGFPLSNVLGDSVKITRGTIAGVVNTSGHKLFQVDASINPGNSGGPLVNEKGEVVGVASAKIAREDVDGVGFVVPANDVATLLRSKGISLPPSSAGQKLDGPALARRVTPAVALIKVTIGPGGFGSTNRLLLDYSGNVVTTGAPRTVGRATIPGHPNFENDRGKLMLSERGEMLNYKGNVQLPYLLGPVGAFPIEPLAADNQRSWRTQQATALTQIVGEQSNAPFSMRFRGRSRHPFGQQNQTQVVVIPAMETCTYELVGTSGDVATIRKQYNFETLGSPVAKMTGDGTITFNRAKGCAEKMDFRATLVRNVSNVSVTVPLTLEWHRLSPAELAQRREQAKAAQEKAQANRQANNQQAAQRARPERVGGKPQSDAGEDTDFVGGDFVAPGERIVDENSLVYGIEVKFMEWMNEQCVDRIEPLFSRDQERTLPVGAVAKQGYAVGAVKVWSGEYINALQLVFMRVKNNGKLDPSDSYTSAMLGGRMRTKPRTLGGDGAPIIGIHIRRTLVVHALAFVVNRDAEAAEEENPFAAAESKNKKSGK